MLSVVNNDEVGVEARSGLDEICREGARTMLAAALEAEVDVYLAELVGERDEQGHRLVTRERPCPATQGSDRGRSTRDRSTEGGLSSCGRGDRQEGPVSLCHPSALAPRSPKVTEVLPLLYLHGLSTGDFVPALEGFFGSAAGLSASVITRLITAGRTSTVPLWPEPGRPGLRLHLGYGVHFNVRLEEERLCCLVIVGVRLDGKKELVAIVDGYRESTDSWAALLRDLRHRGMRAPVVAVEAGARVLGGPSRLFPETKSSDCRAHKVANTSMLCPSPSSRTPTRCSPR